MPSGIIKKLTQILNKLQNVKFNSLEEYKKAMILVEKFLNTIFEIEVAEIKFNESEKNIIGPLIYNSLNTVGSWLWTSADNLNMSCLYQKERSGLQFLFDRHRALPTGTGLFLNDAFKEFLKTENIKEWDERFKYVVCTCVDYRQRKDWKEVPKTHWWWRYV